VELVVLVHLGRCLSLLFSKLDLQVAVA